MHPTRKLVNSLLPILKDEGLDVPLSLHGLLGSYNEKTVVRTVPPGQYFYIGISYNLLKLENSLKNLHEIVIDIGIHRLLLFKSSQRSLWPILGSIENATEKHVFLIGAFIGKKKPNSPDQYLHDFNIELRKLIEEGIKFGDNVIPIKIRAFICDAPACSFVTGVVGHNSHQGCRKCSQIGKTINHVVVYNTTSGDLRTDIDFKNRLHSGHQREYFKSVPSRETRYQNGHTVSSGSNAFIGSRGDEKDSFLL